MEAAQNNILQKSELTFQLQLAEEEKRKIVEEYKNSNQNIFKENFLAINNKINALSEEIKKLSL